MMRCERRQAKLHPGIRQRPCMPSAGVQSLTQSSPAKVEGLRVRPSPCGTRPSAEINLVRIMTAHIFTLFCRVCSSCRFCSRVCSASSMTRTAPMAAESRVVMIPGGRWLRRQRLPRSRRKACGRVIADAWCEAHGYGRSLAYGRADDVTGAVLASTTRDVHRARRLSRFLRRMISPSANRRIWALRWSRPMAGSAPSMSNSSGCRR